jgi:uncharacterized protein (TIGR02246 family)
MKVIALLVALVFVAAPIDARPNTKLDAGEEIRALEQKRVAALVAGDVKALENIFSDDLTYTHSSGKLETKAQFLDGIKSGAVKYDAMNHQDVQARAYGDAVILNGTSEVKVKSEGQPLAFRIRFIAVYVKQRGQWRMVAWQSTRI